MIVTQDDRGKKKLLMEGVFEGLSIKVLQEKDYLQADLTTQGVYLKDGSTSDPNFPYVLQTVFP